jgi:phosphoglycerol transferase MdoB-like AlkP superfamily enzyme
MAFLYNAFLVFVSLTLVYLFRRRAFMRVMVCGFWLILGVINGCVLSNRVTPFGYTDLKCIPDLLAMKNTNYFTAEQATMTVIGLGVFLLFCVVLFIKGPRYGGKRRVIAAPIAIAALMFIGIPLTTEAAQNTHVVESYFSNIAQGYENYGFIYGFSSSVVSTGMSKPSGYSEETIDALETAVAENKEETVVTEESRPNIICVLLESVCDPEEINFLEVNEDPLPTFHYLEENYSSGYLTVPVVGAGTANSEFEVLTGMCMQYFGTGEYPYKTILKKTDCESIASDLTPLGYATHAVHNNGGNFYSRVNAFSMMGFNTFTSKELMDITEYTPLGSWPTDDILVDETIKTLDSTPDQPDFTYTITVGTHGDYPTYQVIEDPQYVATGSGSEETDYQWTYYVNQLAECDRFISALIEELSNRDEDTIVVMFGDHLPTLGLTDEDMRSGDIYKTKYITWNNMGLEKKDADLYAYQLLASVTDSIGIHEGTVLGYHQAMDYDVTEDYLNGLENLQYDILYGERYCYDGEDAYPATDIVMGIDDVVIDRLAVSELSSYIYIYGENFTKWSKVYVNDEKVSTTYLSSTCLQIKKNKVSEGDTIVVSQVGSSSSRFRDSNEVVYEEDLPVEEETETLTETETEIETEVETETELETVAEPAM